MGWISPVPFLLDVTDESESFKTMREGHTGLPVAPHPGSFGFERKHHVHEGVDLYVPEGTPVHAVEDGTVVAIMPFTGFGAGSPWWHDTWAVMVKGESGVVLYGEIKPLLHLHGLGDVVRQGEIIGHVTPVLKNDKGRPMSMLHLELYEHGVREPVEWLPGQPKPKGLLDPTAKLCG